MRFFAVGVEVATGLGEISPPNRDPNRTIRLLIAAIGIQLAIAVNILAIFGQKCVLIVSNGVEKNLDLADTASTTNACSPKL